jgi:hypothetical protein
MVPQMVLYPIISWCFDSELAPCNRGEPCVSLDEALQALEDAGANLRFRELLALCARFFGEARIRGSHHIFKMPWAGDPRINLQEDGGKAQPYQVRQVMRALKRLKEQAG